MIVFATDDGFVYRAGQLVIVVDDAARIVGVAAGAMVSIAGADEPRSRVERARRREPAAIAIAIRPDAAAWLRHERRRIAAGLSRRAYYTALVEARLARVTADVPRRRGRAFVWRGRRRVLPFVTPARDEST